MAKYCRGHRNVDHRASGRVAMSVIFGQNPPSIGMYATGWPIANTVDEAVSILLDCKIVNVPSSITQSVSEAYLAAITPQPQPDPLDHYDRPVYDEKWQCQVCISGGFCQEAADELAHDIACLLLMSGELHGEFATIKQDVLRWMAQHDIRGGNALTLCDSFKASKEVHA